MSTKYQYENLLRKPYEYISAAFYMVSAAFLFFMSELLMMPFNVAIGSGIVCVILGIRKFREGYRFTHYQRSLVYIKPFKRSSNSIGTSNYHLWLGLGFSWNQKHAQRMHDLSLAKNAHFTQHGKWYERVRKFEMDHEHSKGIYKLILKFTRSEVKLNPFKPINDLGGKFQLHGVGIWEGEKDIVLPLSDRNGHALVLGTTRVGKTRLLEVLVSQDIRRDEVVVVIDPKGDADLLLRMYAECKASGREENFHIFHLGYPEVSEAYNPIGSFMRATEVASRIAGQMPSEGQSATFKDFVWGYVNTIAVALIKMGIIPTYTLIKAYSSNLEELFVSFMQWYFEQHPAVKNTWEADVKADEAEFGKAAADRNEEFKSSYKSSKVMREYKARTQALYKFYRDNRLKIQCIECEMMMSKIDYDANHLAKLTASLQPFLDKLTTGDVSRLLVPDYESNKPAFNWNDIIQNGGVVYVGLDALSDPEVAGAVGNSMFADLTSIAGRIYKEGVDHGLPTLENQKAQRVRKICIHADEFNELIGKEFIPMLNKAGGAGIQVTAYTQTLPDIEARLGSTPKAGQVIGNFNTLIMLRVLEKSTVELMTQRHNKVQVVTTDTISGASDVNDPAAEYIFTSNVTQRSTLKDSELINPEDILSLPKGQAFVEMQGNRLYKIRMPMPDSADLKGIPSDLRVLAEDMRKNYKSDTKISEAKPLIMMPKLSDDEKVFFSDNTYIKSENQASEIEFEKRDNAAYGAVSVSIAGTEGSENYDGGAY